MEKLISERLGERERKLGIMLQCEKRQSRRVVRRRWLYYGGFVAAVVAVVFFVIPLFHTSDISSLPIERPDFTEYRGGEPVYDIEEAVDAEDYENALRLVERDIEESKRELSDINKEDINDEEKEYLNTLYSVYNDDREWQRIYLLVKLNRKEDVVAALERYLALGDNTNHHEEAKRLRAQLGVSTP